MNFDTLLDPEMANKQGFGVLCINNIKITQIDFAKIEQILFIK